MTRVCIIAGKIIKGLKLSNKEQAVWNRHLAMFSNTRRRKRYIELNKRGRYKIKDPLHYIQLSNDSKGNI